MFLKELPIQNVAAIPRHFQRQGTSTFIIAFIICHIFFFCPLFTKVFEGSPTVPVHETNEMLARP